jgi:DNA-directed RNA polymerase subunit RPC12/RpoP
MTESHPLPRTDIVLAFDNNQVIGKTHRVTQDSRQKVSTVTSMVAFKYLEASTLQFEVSPPSTIHPGIDFELLFSRYETFCTEANAVSTQFREILFNALVQRVKSCEPPSCKRQRRDLPYSHVKSMIKKVSAVDLPCVMENPNSHDRVKIVLNNILKFAEDRKWIVVFCDGLPFGLAEKSIDEEYKCLTCGKTGKRNDLTHQQHPNCSESNLERLYKKIILRPGKFVSGILHLRCTCR